MSLDMRSGDPATRAQEDDALTLYERAPCGYLSTAPDGTIVRVNQTLLAWTGYTAEELVGRRTFASLLTAGGRIYHDTHYAPMLTLQDTVREIAVEVVRADRTRLPVLVNAVLERDHSGRPHVVRVVLLDATERRQYERELLAAKRRAEESEARARSLATTLQQTLIPPTPPRIPGLEVDAAYRPAGTGEEVGGDFYDVFEVGPDDWVVVLGDVCGKGVDAAVVTTLVRHTVRALAVRLDRPAPVLAALDEVLQHHPTERFCTIALLRLRRHPDGWHFAMALGGHPPALLGEAGGAWEQIGEPGSLVGALPDGQFTESSGVLRPGARLVLFTDGVTEGRRGDDQYGEARLRACLRRHRDEPDLAGRVLEDVLDFQGGRPRDDIAVLVLSVPSDGQAPPSS